MSASDNAQDKTTPTTVDRASGDKLDQTIDDAVHSGPEIPGQDQQTKVDRASGDEVDHLLDDAVHNGPDMPGRD
jgi:hypothetical protein